LNQCRTFPRHEKHLLSAVEPGAQMREGVAQAFPMNDSERRHKIPLKLL
jgi:hypothetical protein